MNQAALSIVEQENQVEVRLRATAMELCESAGDIVIMTRPDLSHATDVVKAIKTRTKEIEDERTRIVKPFNEGVKAINARFKAMTAPLEDAETSLKGKMLTFQKEEERRAREEEARIAKAQQEAIEKSRKEQEEAAASGGDDIRSMPIPEAPIAIVAPIHKPTTYGQTGAVSTVKKTWAFEVVDIKALAAARPDLVRVDDVRVNQIIRGIGGDIAGLRIFQKEHVDVR